MQSPRTRCPSHSRARSCAAVLSFLCQTGCLDSAPDGPIDPIASTGSVDIEASPWRSIAARGTALEPGGRLVVELRDPARRRQWTDSLNWDGNSTANIGFRSIPQGGNYLLVGRYRDASGRTTHSDSLAGVSVSSGQATNAQLRLRALIGRLVFSMPSVPASVESLRATWKEPGRIRQASTERGTGGRTVLRLDSLPVGATGTVSLRAWNAQGDTLYLLDTTLSVLRDADQSVALVWKDATGPAGIQTTALAGGEIDAAVRFPDEAIPTGRLRFAGLSDSGASDWILLENPGPDTLKGPWKVQHGTESASFGSILPPGGRILATRASCDVVRSSPHLLGGVQNLACEVELPVAWTVPSSLWEIRDPQGELLDQVLVWDGQNGWPDLNASNARTLRRRPGDAGSDAMAGRSWCALGSGDPAQQCP